MCSYKIIGENHIIIILIIIIIITHSNNHSFVEIKLVISSSSCEGAHGAVAKATDRGAPVQGSNPGCRT